MIHFYCLAVEAGFYSDVVECRTLNPADRVRSPVGENVIWIFSPFLLHLVASVGVAALEPDGRSKCWVVTRSLRDICIGMNAYKCLVIGRRDVAVRYMIHFYCLAVEADFYSDVVECRTLNPADRVRSPVGETYDLDFFSFPITNVNVTILVVFTLIFKRKKNRAILSCCESYMLNTKKYSFYIDKTFFFLQCKNNES